MRSQTVKEFESNYFKQHPEKKQLLLFIGKWEICDSFVLAHDVSVLEDTLNFTDHICSDVIDKNKLIDMTLRFKLDKTILKSIEKQHKFVLIGSECKNIMDFISSNKITNEIYLQPKRSRVYIYLI